MKGKRLAVLTSGGDSPGMNACIRAIVRAATDDGIPCLGVMKGYDGLINGNVIEMNARSVDGLMVRGGTKLFTARSKEFETEEGLKRAADTCKYLGIGGLIVIGGDGTFRGARDLSKFGVGTIGIPATIDNDIACTDYTIGFDTACNTAIEMIDKLRDTMQSHLRCSVVEVMGRRAGHLALLIGIAAGASAILIPEKETDFQGIVDKIQNGHIQGKQHHIIIVAEGVGGATELAEKLKDATGIDTRVTILGHVQRGGSPSPRDRIMATRMGVYAVDLFKEGKANRVIVRKNGTITDYDIAEALAMKKPLDESLYQAALRVSY